MRTLAGQARALAGTAELTDLVESLRAGDSFAREAALFLAIVGRADAALRPFLADPDHRIRSRAVKAWLATDAVPRGDLAAVIDDAPAQTRAMIYFRLRAGRESRIADTIVDGVRARFGPAEAARLLPACSPQTVARLLPEVGPMAGTGKALGRRHPEAVLDVAKQQLRELPPAVRGRWWLRFGPGVYAAGRTRPDRLFELLERYSTTSLPVDSPTLAMLARSDPGRLLDLLTATERRTWLRRAYLAPAVLRALASLDDDRLAALGVSMNGLERLLAELAPSRRARVFDQVFAGVDRRLEMTADAIMEVLPHERRVAEARRILGLDGLREAQVLHYKAFLPWYEARPVLTEATRASLAEERAVAYEELLRCARRMREPAAVTDAVTYLTRMRNEQDPVRSRALSQLAAVPGELVEPAAVDALTTIAGDATAARDVSWASRSALQSLALSVLRAHPATATLARWSLLTLEAVFGDDRVPYLGRLDVKLRHGQEAEAFAVVKDWIVNGMKRGKYSLLFAFATALGRRAYALPDLQDLLRQAAFSGAPSPTVRQAIDLWLADPAARGQRVEQILRADPSTIALYSVWSIVDRQRQDLLDLVIGKRPPSGPFLAKGVRFVPSSAYIRRWPPRHRARYVDLLRRIARDAGAAPTSRAAAIRSAAVVPDLGRPFVEPWLDSPNTVLAEAALGALPWTDRPVAALTVLLRHTGDDQARVAVYAARRAARFTPPSQLGGMLTLDGSKVTARKELLRLAADFAIPDLATRLYAEWSRPEAHTDVRAAIVSAALTRRDLPYAWDILASAGSAYATAVPLLSADPLTFTEAERPRYAALVLECCRSPDQKIADRAWAAAALWAPWAADITSTILAGVTDLSPRGPWYQAVEALVALVLSGNSSSLVDSCLRRLVELDAADRDADPERDRAALARVDALVTRLSDAMGFAEPSVDRASLIAAAQSLASYDPAVPYAALLWVSSAPAPDLAATLAAVCDLLSDRPVAASELSDSVAQIVERLRWDGTVVASVAEPLRDRGDAAGGLFAVALAELGEEYGWASPYRELVLSLRQHPVADVRTAALAVRMQPE